MGKLSESPFEARLAATLFLLLLGLANVFGAWQVRNFASFTPKGVAAALKARGHHEMTMECCSMSTSAETPIEAEALNRPDHRIDRDLLVQDSHVHIPAYAMTAALLSLVVLGLDLTSRVRAVLVSALFGAPFLDFAGLWGAHLFARAGTALAALAVAGGFAMGGAYTVILGIALFQLWIRRKEISHA